MSWSSRQPFPPRQVLALYALVSATAVPAFAQSVPPAPQAEDELPVVIQAEEIGGRPDRRLDLNRNSSQTSA